MKTHVADIEVNVRQVEQQVAVEGGAIATLGKKNNKKKVGEKKSSNKNIWWGRTELHSPELWENVMRLKEIKIKGSQIYIF